MKHGRGTRGAAPASDAAGCSDRRGRRCPRVRPRRATWIPRAFRLLAPTQADAAPTRTDSARIGPTQA